MRERRVTRFYQYDGKETGDAQVGDDTVRRQYGRRRLGIWDIGWKEERMGRVQQVYATISDRA